MAAKKSRKKTSPSLDSEFLESDAPLEMLQNLLSTIPDDVRMNLLSSLMGGPPEDLLVERPKPRTKAQREIDCLLDQARRQATTNEALPFLWQAEEAAKKAIGKRFEKLVGRLGETAAGETYLDVRLELAEALDAAGQRDAALAHLEEVYRLDPRDPLEVRCRLLKAYLDLDRLEDANRALERDSPEPWAVWNFGRLLVALRRGERGKEVAGQLKIAHRTNPFVLSLLLGERMPDAAPPSMLETGEDSEAQEFAAMFLPAWKNTPGAISWLRDTANRLKLDVVPPANEAAALQLSARDYAGLPRHKHATWNVLVHETGKVRFPGDEQPKNHWLAVALSAEYDLIGFDICTRKPSPRRVWQTLTEFMMDDQFGGRPATMLVHPPSLLSGLQKEAANAKVTFQPLDDPDRFGALLRQLTDRMLGGAQAGESVSADVIRNAPLDVDDVWEAAIVQLDQQLTIAGHSLRPSVALVMTRANGTILWHELFTDAPPEGALANAVRMAIARPAVGPSRRPRQIIVRDNDEAVSLAGLADEAGFLYTAEHELPLIATAVARLTEQFLGGEPAVVLTKGQGTIPADLERYYTAAAAFFRAQPWKHFAMDELIGLDRQAGTGGRHYALVMGQSGITLGMAVYEQLKDVEAMFERDSDFDERVGPVAVDSFSVMFGEASSIAPADLDAIEQLGWPIATPEAYPDALRIHTGPRVETPTANELRFLTAAMQAIAWLTLHGDQKTATAGSGDDMVMATRLGHLGSFPKE